MLATNWNGLDFESRIKRELAACGCRYIECRSLDHCEKIDCLIVGANGERDFHRSIRCQFTVRRNAIQKMRAFLKRQSVVCPCGLYLETLATCHPRHVAEQLLKFILDNNLPYDGKDPGLFWVYIGKEADVHFKPLQTHIEELEKRETRMLTANCRKQGQIYVVTPTGLLIQDNNGRVFFCYDHDLDHELRRRLEVGRPGNERERRQLDPTVHVTFFPDQPREGAKYPLAKAVLENSSDRA